MKEKQNQVELEKEYEINLLEILLLLLKHKMLIFKVCSAAIIVSIVYSLTLPNIYSATATVLPPQKDNNVGLSALLGQAGGLAGLVPAGLGGAGADLYIGILNSRSVGDAVVRRMAPQVTQDSMKFEAARAELKHAVKIVAGKEGIISITAEDRDPKRAAQIANTFVDELGNATVRLNLSKASSERVFLEKRLQLVKRDLRVAEDDLKNYSQRNKIVDMDSQAMASIQGIAGLKSELASKEVQLAALRKRETDRSPDVVALLAEINRLKIEIKGLAGNSAGGEGIPSIGTVPGVGLDFARKVRELKTQEAIFEQLMKQYEGAKLNEAKDSSSFQVLDEAVAPVHKSKPKRTIIVLASTVVGFLVSVLIIFSREYFGKMSEDDRKSLGDLKKALFFKKA